MRTYTKFTWILTLTFLLPGWNVARADTASDAFAKGEALLKKGDFLGAQKCYAIAARADQNKQEYLQHFLMVRQVLDMRQRLTQENDPQQWDLLARGLRAFYVQEKILSEALALDQKRYEKERTPGTALRLAETYLGLNRNAEVIKLLSAPDAGQDNGAAKVILGIALARTGKKAEAKHLAGMIQVSKEPHPGLTYGAARLAALTGDSTKALNLLKNAFETTPPSRLEGFKTEAKECPDFVTLASSPEFNKVLETRSLVQESNCSGGSDCSTCPMRGKCPKSQTQNP